MPATSSLWSPNHSVQGRGRWGPPAAGRVGAAGSPPSPVRTCPGRPLGPRVLLAHSNSRKLRTPPGTGTSDRRASRRAVALPAHHAHDPRAGRRACRKLRRREGSGERGMSGRRSQRGGRAPPRARAPVVLEPASPASRHDFRETAVAGPQSGMRASRPHQASVPPRLPAQSPKAQVLVKTGGAPRDTCYYRAERPCPARAPAGPASRAACLAAPRRLLPPSGLTPWQGRLPEP